MAGQRHHRSRGWKLFLAAVWCFLHFLHISDPALAVNPSLPSNPSDKASALRTNLQQLTVKQLRAELRERGLPVSGRKADLVDRLLTDCWQKFRDWEDKNLAAGRQYELFQLLCQNIDAILMLLDGPVRDYRRLRVCYSAQMFGAGKTTWGDNFLSQINSEDFEDYARKMISKRSQKRQKDWVAEWQRAKEARQLYVDARGRRTVDEVLDVIQQEGNIATEKLWFSESFCRLGFDHCISRTGQSPFRAQGNDVSLIRNGIRATWQEMNDKREKEMPRIYFFLSGKGIPMGAISKWTSAVGTREILLDHLHQESGRDQQTRES